MRRLILVLLLLVVCASPALATDVYISDQGGSHVGYIIDTFLNASLPDRNYGTDVRSFTGDAGGNDLGTIWRVDLSMIPVDSTIDAAEIVLEVTTVSGGGVTIRLHPILAANHGWVEGAQAGAEEAGSPDWNHYAHAGTNWAGSPGLSTGDTDYNSVLRGDVVAASTGTKTLTLNASGLTDIEGRLASGNIEYLFRSSSYATNEYAQWHSSEAVTPANRPYLKITYTSESSMLKVGECTDCDSSIVPDTRLIEDTHNNGGILDITNVGWALGNAYRTIIRFPLDQEELSGATITAATFGCNVSSIGGIGNATIEIHEIAAANLGWTEGTKFDAPAGAGEPDWFHFSHESPATTWAGSDGLSTGGGTDYVDAVYGSFNGTSTGLKTSALSGAAITYLNSEIGNAAEFLLFTTSTYGLNRTTAMASSEAAPASARPYLALTYTPAEAPAPVALQAIIIRR